MSKYRRLSAIKPKPSISCRSSLSFSAKSRVPVSIASSPPNNAGGTLTNNGKIDSMYGTFTNNGTYAGNGTIIGSWTDHGVVKSGNSAGVLTTDGDYYKRGGSKEIELGGLADGGGDKSLTEFDWLDVTGNVELAGALDVYLISIIRVPCPPAKAPGTVVLAWSPKNSTFPPKTGAKCLLYGRT